MPPEETDRSAPEIQDIPEDDLAATAHGLTGRDAWHEYIQKKTHRFRLGEAKGILANSTCLHSQEEKHCLSEAADRLQSSSAVLESLAASIPADRLGEYYRALWEFGNANHDIGVFTKFTPAAFERSKRDLNAARGKKARHGKMLTKHGAKKLCPVANGILRQQASLLGVMIVNMRSGTRQFIYRGTNASTGQPYEVQPSISPDGRWVLLKDAREQKVLFLEMNQSELRSFLST